MEQNQQKKDELKEEEKEEIKENTTKTEEDDGNLQKDECEKCGEYKKEIEEYKAGWQRALADYQNLQKEILERRNEWMQMSEQQILEEFIPVYDHLKMSVNGANNTDNNPWLEGVKHVLRQFAEILRNHGVEEIKTVGEKFDPAIHEAVDQIEEEGKVGLVIKEVSSGYIMGGRTIKAAKVVVGK